MERRPGTPSLLRELNDRAALDLLLPGIPLTRTQISEQTRVSKVTVAQMLARLEERGLVTVVGQQEGGRGPNAALYSVVPSSAYVAGLYVEMDGVSAGVADVTGRVVAEVSVNPNGAANPVELARGAVDRACRTAGVEMSRLSAFVIGSPGVVDPHTGDPSLAINLPDWHEGILGSLRGALNRPVIIENDVNLAAMAERARGAAAGPGRLRPGVDRRWSRDGGVPRRQGAPGGGRRGWGDRLPAGTRGAAAGRRPPPGQRRSAVAGRRQRGAHAGRRLRLPRADCRAGGPRCRGGGRGPPAPARTGTSSRYVRTRGPRERVPRRAGPPGRDRRRLGGRRPRSRPGCAGRRRGPGRRCGARQPGGRRSRTHLPRAPPRRARRR